MPVPVPTVSIVVPFLARFGILYRNSEIKLQGRVQKKKGFVGLCSLADDDEDLNAAAAFDDGGVSTGSGGRGGTGGSLSVVVAASALPVADTTNPMPFSRAYAALRW